jgi:hypothetical protein
MTRTPQGAQLNVMRYRCSHEGAGLSEAYRCPNETPSPLVRALEKSPSATPFLRKICLQLRPKLGGRRVRALQKTAPIPGENASDPSPLRKHSTLGRS